MFTLPDLPYAYNALEPYIDEATMHIHHDKHHAAYVKNVNDAIAGIEQLSNPPAGEAGLTIDQLLGDLAKVPQEVRTKVKNNGGGHANHTLFWSVMTPFGSPEHILNPSGELAKSIDDTFGSFDTFQEQFSAKAMNRFGSGWVWLIVDPSLNPKRGHLAIMDTPYQDSPIMEAVPAGRQGKTPVLTLDVWEHAYYLKYQNMRGEYVKNWWNVVNWKEVERKFLKTTSP